MLLPYACDMQNMVALPSSQVFFKLHCMLHLVNEMNSTQVYKKELFGGKECAHGCCSTQIDSLGDVGNCDNTCTLFSNTKAQNTIDAILSSRHCICKVSSPIMSFGCDCSVWSALHKHRWENVDTPLYQTLNKRLEKCSSAATKLQKELLSIKEIATRELELVCHGTDYTSKALEHCNNDMIQFQISHYSPPTNR